jgi:hypothetical protein
MARRAGLSGGVPMFGSWEAAAGLPAFLGRWGRGSVHNVQGAFAKGDRPPRVASQARGALEGPRMFKSQPGNLAKGVTELACCSPPNTPSLLPRGPPAKAGKARSVPRFSFPFFTGQENEMETRNEARSHPRKTTFLVVACTPDGNVSNNERRGGNEAPARRAGLSGGVPMFGSWRTLPDCPPFLEGGAEVAFTMSKVHSRKATACPCRISGEEGAGGTSHVQKPAG